MDPFEAKNRGDDLAPDLLPHTAKSSGCWRLEWTCIRRCASDHNSEVEYSSEASETDKGVRDGGADGPHVSAESTGEKEEGDLEHHWKALNEEV